MVLQADSKELGPAECLTCLRASRTKLRSAATTPPAAAKPAQVDNPVDYDSSEKSRNLVQSVDIWWQLSALLLGSGILHTFPSSASPRPRLRTTW